MAKKIFSIAIMAMVAVLVSAQDVTFGVKGGLNISEETNMEHDPTDDMAFRMGFHVGGVANFAIDDNWEVEADLLYSMQGFKNKILLSEEQNLDDANYTVTSHYLNLPIALKFFPVEGLYVEGGPQVGYLLSKKDKLKGDDTGMSLYDSSATKKLDFGVFAGLGYRFSNGIFVEGRYIHGLTGTSKLYDGSKNRNIQLSIGYLF